MAKINAVLFDLDGTLLPMDQDRFAQTYFRLLAAKLAPRGYEPKALIEGIWSGTKAMVLNDGSRNNEEAFRADFTARFGEEAREDLPLFDQFYRVDFQQVRQVCGYQPDAVKAIRILQEKGLRRILATNPIFPAIATENRIRWACLEPTDFELITTYENSRFCKPNPNYYKDILSSQGLRPEECLMVGNDVAEDMIAADLGMEVFLLTDCLINKNGTNIDVYPHGDFSALLRRLAEL